MYYILKIQKCNNVHEVSQTFGPYSGFKSTSYLHSVAAIMNKWLGTEEFPINGGIKEPFNLPPYEPN